MNRFRLIINGSILLGTLILIVNCGELFAQSSEEKIRSIREASNAALKALDEEANFEFLTDDVLITTGNGTLLSGKDELKASGAIAEFPDSELLRMLQDYYSDLEQTAINFTNTAIPSRLELRKLKYELFTDTEHRKFFPTNTPTEPGSAVYDSIFNDPRVLPLCRYIGNTSRFFENEFISIQKKSMDISDYINSNYR